VKRNFLIVASDARVRETLAGELWNLGFSVTRAVNGAEAERVVHSVSVDAVLTESDLPDMSGTELAARLRQIRPDCRVVVLTSFDQVKNSPEQMRFGEEDYLLHSKQLLHLLDAANATSDNKEACAIYERGNQALVQVVDVLVGLLEIDDRFFGGFSHQVMLLARDMAEEISGEEDAVMETVIATLLRDVGKVDVEPEVLAEEGMYTKEQEERMRAHVDGSVRLFEHVQFPWKVLPIIRHHHERYDGKGYPDGLSGREIPMGARIISVVDAYMALTSGRLHRAPLEADQALSLLVSESGRQFDPEIVETLQRVLDRRQAGRRTKGKPRILVAEPRGDFRMLIKMRLLNEGYKVAEAAGIEEVMEGLLKDPPDLALVDLDANEDDAFRLLDEMREDESLCRIPLAFLSRREERILKLKALRMGVDDFLKKDEDLEELTARVGAILTREAVRRDGPARPKRRGITGDLHTLSLPDIIQTLVMGMKTACVTLNRDGLTGSVWFENGAVRHAKTHDEVGEDAFLEMVRWTTGEFVIEHGIHSKEISIKRDTMYLLMEGMRMLDEAHKGEEQAVS
jgi:response regulator RpfG family c-di-GMP phosphodiesterase